MIDRWGDLPWAVLCNAVGVGLPAPNRGDGRVLEVVMADSYPNDADGGALRRIQTNGSDMSKPMFIDFQIAAPDQVAAEAIGASARQLGYRVTVYDSPGDDMRWTCECSTRMLATYDGVIAIQAELARISLPLGGQPDGWGTFGNGPTGQPSYDR